MKLIAHRGNINGPDSLRENHPDYIEQAIAQGFDVEIDIRYASLSKRFYLGHDASTYGVTLDWLEQRKENLWIHCKNIDALEYFVSNTDGYNYFWHQEDNYTLTSKKYIWTYPGKPYTFNAVIVMPEWNTSDWDSLRVTNCFGICTDYPEKLK